MTANRPIWQRDSSVSSCGQCKVNFSFDVRRHHCRHCGSIFCHYCSSKSRTLLNLEHYEPVRVCDKCFEVCATKDIFIDAVRCGDLRAAQNMLESRNVHPDDTTGKQTPLLVAASRGHAEMLELLLDHGANVHALPQTHHSNRNLLESELPRGDSPLHYAAINGSTQSVELLMKLDADLNRRSSRYGETPLHKAVLFGHVEIGLSASSLCSMCGDEEMRGMFEANGQPVQPLNSTSIRNDPEISPEKMPGLLWNILVALYLYKRPRRARIQFADSLVALHSKGYPVELHIPQLCDLALHEPQGDNSVKHALLSLSASCATFAFSVWFFMRSVQEAAPRTARSFLEVMETAVMGVTNSNTSGSCNVFSGTSSPPAAMSPLHREASDLGDIVSGSGSVDRDSFGHSSSTTVPRQLMRDDTIESWDTLASADPLSGLLLMHALELGNSEMNADTMKLFGEQCSWSVAPTPKERRSMFMKSRKMVRVLTDIGAKLPSVSPTFRKRELQVAVDKINERIPPCLYLPVFQNQYRIFWLLSVPCEELTIFRTNKRVPYMCIAEINAVIPTNSETTSQPPQTESSVAETGSQTHEPSDHQAQDDETSGRTNPEGAGEVEGAAGLTDSVEPQRYAGGPDDDGVAGAGTGKAEGGSARGRRRGNGGGANRSGSASVSGWMGGTGEYGPGPMQPDGPDACVYLEKEQKQTLDEIFGETWAEKRDRIQAASPHGHLPHWDLVAFIVKSGDDLRQEQFAMQLINEFHQMFKAARTRLWVRPYCIVSTSADTGLIEVVPDTVSLHALRAKFAEMKLPDQSLGAYFIRQYGPENSRAYKTAQRNFIESMAGYAVVCYLLQVKDRNDGNLLLTRNGHILHIDYGYMLTNTPGDMAFEQAPFKLTSEFVDVMGGKDSASFAYFRELCVQGFLEARKRQNCEKIILLAEMMSNGIGGELSMPCVAGQTSAELVSQLRSMFMLGRSEDEVRGFVDSLIGQSLDNWYTRQYDNYQVLQKTFSGLFGGW